MSRKRRRKIRNPCVRRVKRDYLTVFSCSVRRSVLPLPFSNLESSNETLRTCYMQDMYGFSCKARQTVRRLRLPADGEGYN